MSHPRQPALQTSETTSVSSSSSSPERAVYDDTDFFTAQRNDSQSSLGVASLRDMTMSSSLELEHRISPRQPPPSRATHLLLHKTELEHGSKELHASIEDVVKKCCRSFVA